MKAVVSLTIAAAVFAASYALVLADTTCPNPGERPTVASDAVVQNGQLPVGICYNPNTIGINQTAEQAKQDLYKMANGSGGSCQTTAQSSFEQLDPAFAVCADRFLQAVRQRDPNVHITSAYRNNAQQACVCRQTSGPCAAPGNSLHQQGLAIDIQDGSSNTIPAWIHQAAAGYGITFPVKNDDGHMQPLTGSNCSDPNFKPTDTSGGNTPPAQTLTNPLQQTLRPTTPQAAQSSPLVSSSQPLTQSAATPAPTTIPSSPLASPTVTAADYAYPLGTLATPSPVISSTTSQLLQSISTTLSSFAVATQTSLSLNISTEQIGSSLIVQTIIAGTTSTTSIAMQVEVPSTFTSATSNAFYVPAPSASTSTISQILDVLKGALLQLLSYITPAPQEQME